MNRLQDKVVMGLLSGNRAVFRFCNLTPGDRAGLAALLRHWTNRRICKPRLP